MLQRNKNISTFAAFKGEQIMYSKITNSNMNGKRLALSPLTGLLNKLGSVGMVIIVVVLSVIIIK